MSKAVGNVRSAFHTRNTMGEQSKFNKLIVERLDELENKINIVGKATGVVASGKRKRTKRGGRRRGSKRTKRGGRRRGRKRTKRRR